MDQALVLCLQSASDQPSDYMRVRLMGELDSLPSVWGEDVDVWNPDRFLDIDPTKQTKLGVYANL